MKQTTNYVAGILHAAMLLKEQEQEGRCTNVAQAFRFVSTANLPLLLWLQKQVNDAVDFHYSKGHLR